MSARRVVGRLVVAALAAGCDMTDDIAPVGHVPRITLTPAELTARVGDPVAVHVVMDEPPRSRTTARWRSEQPAIVRLDTTVAPGRIATGVAVAPGLAVLLVTITHDGQTVTASIPATVLPR